jgi:putative hydrolase of the HAD superfamily
VVVATVAEAAVVVDAAGSGPPMTFDGVEAVCLDLDDTLVDARAAWHAGFAEVTATLWTELPALAGLGSPAEVYDGPLRTLMNAAQRRRSSSEWSYDLVHEAFREFFAEIAGLTHPESDALAEAYRHAWPRHVQLYPEVPRVLDALHGRYPLGLISNGLAEDQRQKIDAMSLGDYFEVQVISEEAGITKPAPEIFHLALSALGVEPSAAIYVGDNPHHDVVGARGVGMRAVWLNRPGNRFDEQVDADAEIANLDELLGLLS